MSGKSDVLVLGPGHRFKIWLAGFRSAPPVMEVWKFFTSVKLSIYLLLSLAVTSIIGTVIPQNESPEKYVQAFGENLYRIFDILNVFDMYHSAWFQFLLLMLVVNIVVCSIDRLSATWKIIFVKTPSFKLSRFRAAKNQTTFETDNGPELLKEAYEQRIAKQFRYHITEKTENGFCIFAEKWRWSRLGVYVVHTSVVLLLVGAIIGSMFGFDGYVNIPEGESVAGIRLRGNGAVHDLPFTVRCDAFDVSFYDTGAPKEFRSSLTIIENGQTVLQKDIIVNDPLRYKGINFFQSSYGPMEPKAVRLNITSIESGQQYTQDARLGQAIDLPEGKGTLVVKGFRQNAQYQGQDIGNAFLATLTPKDGNPVFLVLPLQFPQFDRMRKGAVALSVTGYQNRFYTGLQVSRDPGVPVVYAGFVLMIVGCFVTFFMSHQKVCVDIEKHGRGSRVMVAGTANKNKYGMQEKVLKLARKLDT